MDMRALMEAWTSEFSRIYPKVRVKLDDAAFEDVAGSASTFGPWLCTMGEHTRSRFSKRFGFEPTETPVCMYVAALYVQKDGPLVKGVRIKDVESIFSTRNWDWRWGDLGFEGDWAKKPILPHVSRSLSPNLLRRHGADRSFFFKSSVKRCADDLSVVRSIAATEGAMGLASMGCQSGDVRAIPISFDNSSNFIPATAENARDGSYALAEYYYLTLNHDPQSKIKLDALRGEFLRYIMSEDGQGAVARIGFATLTPKAARRALATYGLVPSGEDSPWDRVIAALRLRDVSDDTMASVNRLARQIGAEATYDELVDLDKALASSGLTSKVEFESWARGDVVRYRRVGRGNEATMIATGAVAKIRVGLYHIWLERDGDAITPKNDKFFEVIKQQEHVRVRKG